MPACGRNRFVLFHFPRTHFQCDPNFWLHLPYPRAIFGKSLITDMPLLFTGNPPKRIRTTP
jgi:hypothetical protein